MWDLLEPFVKSFQTGSGFWNPIVWSIALAISFLIIYIIRGMGKNQYKTGTEQEKAFLSGNPEYDKEKMHVKGSNIYWGFTESLSWFFDHLKKMHTGNPSDYIFWFIIVLAILFILIGGINLGGV
jgi:hypothetical protein